MRNLAIVNCACEFLLPTHALTSSVRLRYFP